MESDIRAARFLPVPVRGAGGHATGRGAGAPAMHLRFRSALSSPCQMFGDRARGDCSAFRCRGRPSRWTSRTKASAR
jgi:hypothetical protein